MNCSIIIRAYNEAQHIGRLLRGIWRQTVRDVEIMLVDSGSTRHYEIDYEPLSIWKQVTQPTIFLFAKVETAKKGGSWNALDAVDAWEIPPDLAKALSKNKTAKEYFEAFPRSVKRGILEWVSNAKKPETRAKRIEETITKAEKNIRANQWRQ